MHEPIRRQRSKMASRGKYYYLLPLRINPLICVGLTPVHWLSHGSTMMLGEECEAATYWKKAGDEALANGIKGVVMMVGRWSRNIDLKC